MKVTTSLTLYGDFLLFYSHGEHFNHRCQKDSYIEDADNIVYLIVYAST